MVVVGVSTIGLRYVEMNRLLVGSCGVRLTQTAPAFAEYRGKRLRVRHRRLRPRRRCRVPCRGPDAAGFVEERVSTAGSLP